MSANPAASIIAWLLADTDVQAVVGTRVYPRTLPDQGWPQLSVQQAVKVPGRSGQGQTQDASFRCAVYCVGGDTPTGPDTSAAWSAAAAVEKAVGKVTDTPPIAQGWKIRAAEITTAGENVDPPTGWGMVTITLELVVTPA